jgi:hypothetical protein
MDTIETRGAAEAPGGRIGSGGEAERGLTLAATQNAIRRSTISTPCWQNAYPQPSTFVCE